MIELRAIHKNYGPISALNNASLTANPGEFLTILGPSGCGKSTLLRIAGGYEPANSGQVLVNGQDVSHLPPEARNIGMVFQNYALFPHMSVLENVEFGLRMRGIPRTARRERARAILALVGLPDLDNRRPSELSGGQQQRVALARTFVIEPAALLLDEPLANLDRNVRLHMRDELRTLQQRLRIPTILVTHDQEEALSLGHRVAIMNAGRIEQTGAALDLYLRPATPFVAEFLGLQP